MDSVSDLLKKVGDFVKIQQKKHTSGGEFNALEVCRIGSDEVRHSAILAELLNPCGTHGLGITPLKIFFKEIGLTEFADMCDDCIVDTEVAIPGRRMDIVISNPHICVVIENKTETVDHFRQLVDYAEWLKKQQGKRWALAYLTYRGDKASDASAGNDYFPISYEKNISSWLKKCAKCAQDQGKAAASFFQQYADFITNRLLQEENAVEKKEWQNILSSRENFQAAQMIAEHFASAKEEAFILLLNEWSLRHSEIKGTEIHSAVTYGGMSFKSDREDFLIRFEFEAQGFRNLIYGAIWTSQAAKKELRLEDWQKSDGWAFYRYFEKDFRYVGDHIEFLFDRKQELFNRLDLAFREIQSIIAQLP